MMDFETNGASQYGAQMGRRSELPHTTTSKCFIRRVKLDSGGYDKGGAYWGLEFKAKDKLWMVEAVEGEHEGLRKYLRRADRNEIKAAFPKARWTR